MTALPIEIGSYHHFPSVGAFDYTTLGTFHAYNIPQAIQFCLNIQNIQKHINLTDREAEVVELLTYGKTNSEIADVLNISASTVAGYVKSIFIKLDVSDRVSASMRAQTIKVAF